MVEIEHKLSRGPGISTPYLIGDGALKLKTWNSNVITVSNVIITVAQPPIPVVTY